MAEADLQGATQAAKVVVSALKLVQAYYREQAPGVLTYVAIEDLIDALGHLDLISLDLARTVGRMEREADMAIVDAHRRGG